MQRLCVRLGGERHPKACDGHCGCCFFKMEGGVHVWQLYCLFGEITAVFPDD